MSRTYGSPGLVSLVLLSCTAGAAFAGDLYNKGPAPTESVALPTPAEVLALTAQPAAVSLKGGEDANQLVVTARLGGDRLQDLTGDVTYEVADARVARVTSAGRVVPLADGATEIVAH